ncbi:hypothetical protein HK099_003239 [Clydaea vesicula]|uniref:Peptidase A1 domain-containing protein n=1 Tax=Clydaea vesicula TaxID=447962 RepID=A0AAD5U3R0_9FUNG|nr:hypothetical protein HK099_003239 [Clydaea vesicula]
MLLSIFKYYTFFLFTSAAYFFYPHAPIKPENQNTNIPTHFNFSLGGLIVELSIGNGISRNAEKFQVLIDTGSSNFFLPSSKCKNNIIGDEENCGKGLNEDLSKSVDENLIFNKNQYKKFVVSKGKEFISYADASTCDGIGIQDILTLGSLRSSINLELATMQYGDDTAGNKNSSHLIKTRAGGFHGIGILGLGFPELNSVGFLPPVQVFYKNDLLTKQLIGLYFGKNSASNSISEGEVSLGWINPTAFFPFPLVYIPITTSLPGYPKEWRIHLQSLYMNGTYFGDYSNMNHEREVLIDSGNPYITLPARIASKINLSILQTNNFGMITENCFLNSSSKQFPLLKFQFNNFNFTLSHRYYLKFNKEENGVCESLIKGKRDENLKFPSSFGQPFLKFYFSIFDYSNQRIGFAIANHNGFVKGVGKVTGEGNYLVSSGSLPLYSVYYITLLLLMLLV